MTLAANIARALGKGKEQKTGEGWSTLCPCHGDKNNSLSVKDDPKNGVIVSCFAGCDYKNIKDTMRDMGLLPEWTPDKKPKTSRIVTPPPSAKDSYQIAENTAEQIKAAQLAGEVWQAAYPAGADHPYLARKQVSPTNLIKEIPLPKLKEIIKYHPKAEGVLLNDGRILIIPVVVKGKISSIEMIDETGMKTALYRGRKKDGYWPTEKISGVDPATVSKILICEGVCIAARCGPYSQLFP
jgi:hypothetical protein